MEIGGFIKRAGNSPEETILILFNFQSGICICGIIPGNYRRVVITLPAPVQINTDRLMRYDAVGLGSQICSGVGSVFQFIEIRRRTVIISIFRELPERRVDQITNPVDLIAAVIDTYKRAVMVYGIKLIFFGRFIPHTGIDDNLGLFRSVNGISVFTYQDITVVILFRRAEDIVTGTNLAGSIFNEVVIRQSGLFDQVQPCVRSAATCRIKTICSTSRKIQRTIADSEMPLAAVSIRSGRGFDHRSRVLIIYQRHAAAVNKEVFFCSFYSSLDIVLVFASGFERPLLDIAVLCNQKDTFVVEHVSAHEHINTFKAALITHYLAICRHSSCRNGIVVIGDAESLAVQFIRVVHILCENDTLIGIGPIISLLKEEIPVASDAKRIVLIANYSIDVKCSCIICRLLYRQCLRVTGKADVPGVVHIQIHFVVIRIKVIDIDFSGFGQLKEPVFAGFSVRIAGKLICCAILRPCTGHIVSAASGNCQIIRLICHYIIKSTDILVHRYRFRRVHDGIDTESVSLELHYRSVLSVFSAALNFFSFFCSIRKVNHIQGVTAAVGQFDPYANIGAFRGLVLGFRIILIDDADIEKTDIVGAAFLHSECILCVCHIILIAFSIC